MTKQSRIITFGVSQSADSGGRAVKVIVVQALQFWDR